MRNYGLNTEDRSKGSANWLNMKVTREKAYRQNKSGMTEKVKREEF